jgi:hypothetical protein
MSPEISRTRAEQLFEDQFKRAQVQALKGLKSKEDITVARGKHGKLKLRTDGSWLTKIGNKSVVYQPSMFKPKELLRDYTMLYMVRADEETERLAKEKDLTAWQLRASVYMENNLDLLRRKFLGDIAKALNRSTTGTTLSRNLRSR